MVKNTDPFGDKKLSRLQLMLYLFPVVGCLPSGLTLAGKQGTTEQRALSRLSLTLTLSWLVLYGLLWTGSSLAGETASLRLLYTNGLITTGYFITCLGLMLRIWQGKTPR
jgi:hypothetical protein